MEPQPDDQRAHAVVIITLPPSDDPSQGKTISAFTLTDHPNPTFQPGPPDPGFWLSDLSTGSPRLVLSLIAISLLAVAFYASVFPNTVQMFRVYDDERDRDDEPNRRETSSFVFPVYHKLGARAIPDRKLAEVVDVLKTGILVKVNDASFDSSTTILPVAGDVYPNG